MVQGAHLPARGVLASIKTANVATVYCTASVTVCSGADREKEWRILFLEEIE